MGPENGAFSSSGPNTGLQEALQAFSLDSADEKTLQAWSTLRQAAPSRRSGALAHWMNENYWPLQSLGLRLVELAQLDFYRKQQAEAIAQMGSVALMAEDLTEFLRDALLQTHLQKIQSLNESEKSIRTTALFSFLRGRLHIQRQDYAAAVTVLQEARAAMLLIGDSLSVADIDFALLDIQVAREEYAAVVREGERCAAFAAKIGYRWLQAQALNKIADAERIRGHDERALACAQQALRTAEELRDWRTQRDSHLYHARIFYDSERYRAAEAALQAAAALDAEHFYQGDILLLQGQMHFDRGEYGLAQEYLERAVAVFDRNQNASNVASAYSTLSLLHLEQGDDQNALATEEKALAIHEREHNGRRTGWSHMNLGLIHARFERLPQAEAALAQAVAQMRQNDEPRALVQALILMGNLQLQQGDFPHAGSSFAEALDRAQEVGFQYGQAGALLGQARWALAGRTAGPADSCLALAEKIARDLREPDLLTQIYFCRARLEQQRQHAAAALDLFEQAIAALEQRFHSIARDSSRMQFFAPAQDIFDEAILLALASGQDERALQFSERARARALLESLGPTAQERELVPSSAVFTVPQMQQALPAKSCIMIYRLTADTLVAWVIGKSSLICRKLPVAQAALTAAVQKFRESLGAIEVGSFANRVARNAVAVYEENRRLGRELFQSVVAPLQEGVPAGEMVYLIPDGALHLLPFGALVTPRDRFWEEECILLRAPSLAMLSQGWRSPRPIPEIAGQRMLIVSNPAGDFPAAQEEKILIAESFPHHKMLQREHARFTALQEELRHGTEILHLSLHALADPVRPLNSYLELSAPTATGVSPQTQRVFARQLLELELAGVWLTFLNGCETASGRVVHGEGALSMVRLFALQRVAVVIATLWKNDDWQSLPIIADFYRELQGGADPATALHRAKIAAISELSQHARGRVALPYFWAVFEMYCNQRVVRGPV